MHDESRSVTLDVTVRSGGPKPVALRALVAMLCIGLASCSNGPVAGSAGRPDLVVERPSVTDPSPAAGTSLTLSATVRNTGGGDTAATTVRVYRSDDASITREDEVVGVITAAELAASPSAASVTVQAPADAGTYYYGLCVTAADGESDTTNNCSAAVRVTVLEAPSPTQEPPATVQEPPRPDLAVQYVTVSEESLVTGQLLQVAARVRNVGDKGAAGTWVHLHLSTDSTITPSDDAVHRERLAGLAPTHSKLAWETVAAPSAPGTYYYGACVTAVDGESNTTNNCSATATPVTVRRASAPDLVITRPHVNSANPAAGGLFGMGAILRNDGTLTNGTLLRYYRSDDATFTASDTEVHNYWWGPFHSHGTFRVGNALDVPASLGTYYYRMCADAVPGESDTTNNCSAPVKIVVSHSKPDLLILSWGVSNWNGPSFPINAHVGNTGGASAATTLRFYQSTDMTFTASDTEIHTVAVGPLAKTKARTPPSFFSGLVNVTPPATGTYHYGACVDAVANESDTTNNCTRVIHTIRR